MPTITEHEDTRVVTYDRTGEITVRREFFVDANVATAVAMPEFLILSQAPFDTVRPGGGPAISVPIDRIDPRPDGIYTRISALYSLDGRFKLFEHVDRADPFFRGWRNSARRVVRKVPVRVNEGSFQRTFAGMAFVPRWRVVAYERPELMQTFSREIVIQTPNYGIIELIRAQTDHIHRIPNTGGGALYRFDAADIDEIDKGVFQTTYSWEADPGTPVLVFDPSSVGGLPPLTIAAMPEEVEGTGLIRTPFREFQVIPGRLPSGEPSPSIKPQIALTLNFVEDFNGHATLPGGPF